MRKECFPKKRWSKLLPIGDGSFQLLQHINDNAHKVDLACEYGVSPTFNVFYLSPFDVDDNLRTNPSKDGENNAKCKPPLKDTIQVVPVGLIIMA